ncbi:hypothetical protein JW766_06505 [Candidatus Dojkabacteria bacterium]|nr:hypothetical protein [Candidatus Dojkabacteria bacterium]
MAKKKKPQKPKKVEAQKVQVEVKEKPERIKKIISYVIAVLLFILLVYIAITIKNGLDDTVSVELENAEELCDNEACIIFDGKYEDGFVDWNIREYWPFFAITIETNLDFENGQEVDIICPVDKKEDTFQYLWTKILFLYKKDNIKKCEMYTAE